MKNDLKTKVKEWISKQGYPLEMRVAEILQQVNFNVNLSCYYEDSREKLYREIDVVATDSICDIHNISFDVRFILECKYSGDKPWIIFQSNSDIELRKHFEILRRFSSKYGYVALSEISKNKDAQNNFLFSLPEEMGYGLTRAFENTNDMTFKAINSVLKATKYFVSQFDSINANSLIGYIAIAFPIIVIDGQLFNCKLNKNNEVEVAESEMGYLLVRNEEYGTYDSIISVVTLKAFPNYVRNLAKGCEDLKTIIKNFTPSLHSIVRKTNQKKTS